MSKKDKFIKLGTMQASCIQLWNEDDIYIYIYIKLWTIKTNFIKGVNNEDKIFKVWKNENHLLKIMHKEDNLFQAMTMMTIVYNYEQ